MDEARPGRRRLAKMWVLIRMTTAALLSRGNDPYWVASIGAEESYVLLTDAATNRRVHVEMGRYGAPVQKAYEVLSSELASMTDEEILGRYFSQEND